MAGSATRRRSSPRDQLEQKRVLVAEVLVDHGCGVFDIGGDAPDPLRQPALVHVVGASAAVPPQTVAIAAAEANDAVLALTGSLYAYGLQPGGRMYEHTP